MAKKAVYGLGESERNFQAEFQKLCYQHSAWQAWADFINMAAIAISNAVDIIGSEHGKREDYYMQLAKGYDKEEIQTFSQLLSIVVNALEENPDQDFLGNLFMVLELGSHWHGQFFTPYNVCRMMAEMQMGDFNKMAKGRGWISINDCACGAGALLIAARNAMMRRELDWTTQALFVAQDIDRTAALMCYIQLSLLGCSGYVVVDNTLTKPSTSYDRRGLIPKPGENIWYTPFYFKDTWHFRRIWAQMDMMMEAVPKEAAEQQEEPPPQELKADKSGQLRLF